MLSGFEYHRPETAEACGRLLADLGPEARLLAGGTDLLVQMRAGRLAPRHVVDLAGVAGVAGIDERAGGIDIRAGTRVAAVLAHPGIRARYEALAEGGSMVGSVQIQNRATVAGNICNASPAADTVPALLVHRATVACTGHNRRSIPLEEFLVGPGRTSLEPGEWVDGVRLPNIGPNGSCYLKLGRTRGVDIALVGVACAMTPDWTRLAFASVGPTAVAIEVEGPPPGSELPADAAELIAERIRPIDDLRASAPYRQAMALVLARRAWRLSADRLRAAQAAQA
ncbi:MAG TPA: FAD binding domain-containing protein [Candidatus Limnocylindrales bacterium]|nr:FAD binding domain-containing protein [Candidatus Limnocylindrales bacterium]